MCTTKKLHEVFAPVNAYVAILFKVRPLIFLHIPCLKILKLTPKYLIAKICKF